MWQTLNIMTYEDSFISLRFQCSNSFSLHGRGYQTRCLVFIIKSGKAAKQTEQQYESIINYEVSHISKDKSLNRSTFY